MTSPIFTFLVVYVLSWTRETSCQSFKQKLIRESLWDIHQSPRLIEYTKLEENFLKNQFMWNLMKAYLQNHPPIIFKANYCKNWLKPHSRALVIRWTVTIQVTYIKYLPSSSSLPWTNNIMRTLQFNLLRSIKGILIKILTTQPLMFPLMWQILILPLIPLFLLLLLLLSITVIHKL